ncbi:MAG: DUF5640 domain-containing protein [Acutalibacteraceae bacterium]
MNKNKKIIIIVVSVFAAIAILIGGLTAIFKHKADKNEASTFPNEAVTSAADGTAVNEGTTAALTTTGGESTSTDPLQNGDLKNAILGKWSDSAGMSGYEFFADGSVEVTYVNLTVPVVNLPVNGTSKGVYTVEGDVITTTFSIYSASIKHSYKATVDGNSLTMYDLEERETATYSKQASYAETTSSANSSTQAAYSDSIVGSWKSSDGNKSYNFKSDSTVTVTVNGESAVNGVYLEDKGSVIIQYTVSGEKITEKYLYFVNGNTLSFTDENGEIHLFVRDTGASSNQNSASIIGTWRDGADMSGYEFKEGGRVNVTYVNFTVPVINMPINGTYEGSYSVNGNEITISFSIYGKGIVDTYTYELNENSLIMTNVESGDTATYVRR